MKQLNKEEFEIANRKVVCFKNDNPEILLLHLVDEKELNVVEKIANDISFETKLNIIYVAYVIKDWNAELSPWPAPAVFGKEDFKGEASKTLDFIVNNLIPEVIKKYSLNNNIRKIIGGYSLAGLFSLWAVYQTNIFDSVVAASPSVWYKDFLTYTKNNFIKTRNVYLSLGDKEEHTKNKTMSLVGDFIRELDLMYKQDHNVDSSILEWNKGNHFVDSDLRIIKGFNWCLNK